VFGISTYRVNQREIINVVMSGRDVVQADYLDSEKSDSNLKSVQVPEVFLQREGFGDCIRPKFRKIG
jgi:hypothetical protein